MGQQTEHQAVDKEQTESLNMRRLVLDERGCLLFIKIFPSFTCKPQLQMLKFKCLNTPQRNVSLGFDRDEIQQLFTRL